MGLENAPLKGRTNLPAEALAEWRRVVPPLAGIVQTAREPRDDGHVLDGYHPRAPANAGRFRTTLASSRRGESLLPDGGIRALTMESVSQRGRGRS
jgi:hypothetical protein